MIERMLPHHHLIVPVYFLEFKLSKVESIFTAVLENLNSKMLKISLICKIQMSEIHTDSHVSRGTIERGEN